MNLLECLLFEIEKNGGIARLYDVASRELIFVKRDSEEDLINMAKYKTAIRKRKSVLNIKTGAVYKSISEAARSEKLSVASLQINLKSGSYKSFVKVA